MSGEATTSSCRGLRDAASCAELSALHTKTGFLILVAFEMPRKRWSIADLITKVSSKRIPCRWEQRA